MCCVIKNYNSICISFYALSFGEGRKSYVTEADSSINLPFPCAHVYVGEDTCGHNCPRVCMCLWSMLSVFLHLVFFSETRRLTELNDWPVWMAIKLQGSSHFCLPSARMSFPTFCVGSGDLNSTLRTYLANTLLTESSVWPLPFYFDSLLFGGRGP